ncbi:NEDD8 ultimate buster 1-like [Anneissia japonica]|uniref:NEDD8 ultimate buster 1-like n=1 Tax=Anneissia japonica TaxID=1529436 RepID=UPI0014254F1F|nr:NEDD8 ultimate buster 1-like [Anneissia japonica]
MNQCMEELEHQVRKKLNEGKIKLWLSPYTVDGKKGEYPEKLIEEFSSDLRAECDVIAQIIEKLRKHALQKLAAKQQFRENGVATLKVKVVGSLPTGAADRQSDLQTKLDISGLALKKIISEKWKIEVDKLKVISVGQVIDEQRSLASQMVKHGSHVMVIMLTASELEANEEEAKKMRLARTKEVAEVLAKRKKDDHERYHLQIADQTGKPINLPEEESHALSVALTLNEKGRACLKRRQYGEALLILLEADKEFSQCRSEILSAVDNYAVLCLDITWCYFCLQNIDALPDAESRLKKCEDCFKRSYGADMERLKALKGDSSRELALFVRLYLLQGIIAFYQRNKQLSIQLLDKVDNFWRKSQLNFYKLTQTRQTYFSTSEARLGLRAAKGHLELAVNKITERRERRKEIAKKETEEHEKRKKQRLIGKAANGEWVNIDVYNTLLSMGFPANAAASALKQCNSDINLALQTLQENPELLNMPNPGDWQGEITEEMLFQFSELGFMKEIARQALISYHGNVQKAIEVLVENGGLLPPSCHRASTSRDHKQGERECLTKEQEEALKELAPDIPEHEEDYLDLTLHEEAGIIEEYLTKLASMRD